MNSKLKLNLLTIADILLVAICVFDAYEYLPSANFLINISKVLSVIYVSIIVYDLIHRPFSIKNYIFSFLLIAITLIATIHSEKTKLLLLTLVILSFGDINFDKFIARDTIIRTLETIILILLFIYHNNYAIYPMSESETRIRYALGFGHPNSLGITLTTIAIEFMYLSRKNWSCLLAYGLSGFIIWFNHNYISSRTSFIVLVFATFSFIVLKIFPKILKFKPFQFIIENFYLIFTVVIFYMIYMYSQNTEYGLLLDETFNARLRLAYGYINYYGISLFGNSGVHDYFTTDTGLYLSYLDSGLIYVVIKYGVIVWLIYAIFYNRAYHYLFKKGNYNLTVIISSFIVSGLAERHLYLPEFFTLAGVLGLWLSDNKKEEKHYKLNTHIISISCAPLIILVSACLLYCINTPSLLTDGLNAINNQYELIINIFNNIGSSQTLSFHTGLINNIYSLISNNVLSPFNIVLPILNKFNLKFSYIYFFTFKVCLASLFTSLWVSKFTSKRESIVLSSLIYSLSCVLLVSFGTNFIDIYCFIPLVLFFIERNIEDNKKIGLFISLIIISLINEIYLIPVFILLIIYTLFRLIALNKNYKEVIIKTLEILLVPLSLSFIVIPCVLNYTGLITNRSEAYGKLAKLLEPINFNNSYSLAYYFSLGSLIILPMIVLIKDKKEKIKLFVYLIISLVLSMALSMYYGQISYVLLIVSYVYLLIKLYDNYNLNNYKYTLIGYLVILIVYLIVLFIYKDNLKIEETSTLFAYAILGILLFTLIYQKKLGTWAINLLIIFEIIVGVNNTLYINEDLTQSKDLNNIYIDYGTNDSLYRTIDLSEAKYYSESNSNKTTTINDYTNNNDEDISYSYLLSENQTPEYIGYRKNLLSYFNISGTKYILNNVEIDNKTDKYYLPEDVTSTTYLARLNRELIDNSVYIIRYKDNEDYVLSLDGNDNVVISEYEGLSSQLWRVSHDSNGFMALTNLANNKLLDLTNGTLDNNTNIATVANNGNSAQKWVAVNRGEGIELLTALSLSKVVNVSDDNVDIYDYSNQLWIFEDIGDKSLNYLPSYYKKINDSNYYENEYYIELGYVNNNTISADYLINGEEFIDTYTREKILKEYVALEGEANTSYSLINEPIKISDVIYDSYYEQSFLEPLNDITLVIKNGSIPIVSIDLYDGENLIKTKHFYQYDFCNVQIEDDEYVDRIVINFNDVDETGSAIILYTMKNSNDIEEKLYNQRINNAFKDVTYTNNSISANIDISEDNSLVYTYIPYDDNWTIKVDGQEVDKLKADYGFIAFRANSGNRNVEFSYSIPNINIYIALSVISFIGLLSLEIIPVIKKRNK